MLGFEDEFFGNISLHFAVKTFKMNGNSPQDILTKVSSVFCSFVLHKVYEIRVKIVQIFSRHGLNRPKLSECLSLNNVEYIRRRAIEKLFRNS